jgi:ribonuclease HI
MTRIARDCWQPKLHASEHRPHPAPHPERDAKTVCFICHPPAEAILAGDLPAPPQLTRPLGSVQLWADGASSPDGCGGWAFILVALDNHGEVLKRIEDAGAETDTTNNRMELLGVIRGLRSLHRSTALTVISDSAYVVNAFLENWFAKWDRDDWTRKVKGNGRQPVANQDLWQQLRRLALHHDITWEHVRGHAGHALNEQCDALAVAAKHALQADRKAAA